MRTRRHHNNTGLRQIKRGKTHDQVRAIARRLGVPYGQQEDTHAPEAAPDERGAAPRVERETAAQASWRTDGAFDALP